MLGNQWLKERFLPNAADLGAVFILGERFVNLGSLLHTHTLESTGYKSEPVIFKCFSNML